MIRAHIHEPFAGLSSLHVAIVNHVDDRAAYVMRIEDSHTFWDEIEPGTLDGPKPTLVLPVDTGRVLLEALTRHYQGAEDTRQLRLDYERERARVDEQAKLIGEVLRAVAGRESTR